MTMPMTMDATETTTVPRRRWRGRLGLALAAAALAALFWGGQRYGLAQPVALVTLEPVPFAVERLAPGVLEATRHARVAASQPGRLARVCVAQNDSVAKGDLLAEIDATELRAEIDALLASEEAARQGLRAARADLARAEAELADAEAALRRQDTLQGLGVSASSTRDSAATRARKARAERDRARFTALQGAAQLDAATASLAAARVRLAQTRIEAPLAGVVVTRPPAPGDYASPATPLLEIVDPASLVLSARFDESALGEIAPGMAAQVWLTPDGTGAPLRGQVARMARQVDPETREFVAEIALEGTPSNWTSNWALGQRGRALLSLPQPRPALVVPQSALGWRGGVPGVWVVSAGGRARWRPVTPGAASGPQISLRAGLSAGETVLARAEDGYPLRLVAP